MMMGEEVKKKPGYSANAHRKLLLQARKTDMPQIEYRTVGGMRHGYIVSDNGRTMIVRLIGDLQNTHLNQHEVKYVTIKGVPDA